MSAVASISDAEKKAALQRRFSIRLGSVRQRLMGISREVERALRWEHLVEGVDWAELGCGICYSEEGLERLRRAVDGEGAVGEKLKIDDCKLQIANREDLDTRGPASRDDTRISADSPKLVNAVRTEAAQPVPVRPRVLALLPERTGELKSAPFLVRTMRCHFPNAQVVEVKVEMGGIEHRSLDITRGFMRVRSSENFLPGMLCWARTERGAANWVFMGRGDEAATDAPAGPRSRGRW